MAFVTQKVSTNNWDNIYFFVYAFLLYVSGRVDTTIPYGSKLFTTSEARSFTFCFLKQEGVRPISLLNIRGVVPRCSSACSPKAALYLEDNESYKLSHVLFRGLRSMYRISLGGLNGS